MRLPYRPPDTVRIGLPVLVIMTSSWIYRRQTFGAKGATLEAGNWAVNAAPERTQWRGKAMVAAFNGLRGSGMYLTLKLEVGRRSDRGYDLPMTPRPELTNMPLPQE